MIIKPTVGRKVWYSPNRDDTRVGAKKLGEQPFDATVVFVHNDRCVNLVVHDHTGKACQIQSVQLLQEDDAPYPEGGHCTWMPYQVGQAKSVAPV